MELVLKKFVEYFHEIYGKKDENFIEKYGRKFILLYLKPIINGTGNYYLESTDYLDYYNKDKGYMLNFYFSANGKTITSLLNRDEIYTGQPPEVFKFKKYYEANKNLLTTQILQINGSTEPAILAGMDIVMIEGDENNFKITTKADLERFEQIIR